jgi:hypothetical protein
VIGGSDEGSGAGGSHGDGGLVGLDEDDALDGDFVGLEFLDDVGEVGADGGEGTGLDDGFRDGNYVESENCRLAGIALKHGVTGVSDGGVDGEDAHGSERGDEAFLGGEGFLICVEGEKMGGTDDFRGSDVEDIKPTMPAGESVGGGEAAGFCENFCEVERA